MGYKMQVASWGNRNYVHVFCKMQCDWSVCTLDALA